MTIKEERAAGLDALKEIGTGSILYVVEWLNGSFDPIATFRYETEEEAAKKYAEILKYEYPAFVRRYAIVPM